MRVCLINPPTTADDEALYFPFCLIALGAALQAAGHSPYIVDFDLLYRTGRCGTARTFLDRAIAHVRQAPPPDVFGITTICANFPVALLLAGRLRAAFPGRMIVLGGPQISSVPLESLTAFPSIDAAVIGEGEAGFVEAIEAGADPRALARVAGVAFRDAAGRAVQTAPRPLIADLDRLPLPAYDLLDLSAYERAAAASGHGFAPAVEAGRGCPFNCTFCSTKSMWAQTFRVKSPARLLDEMERLHARYGYESFPTIHDNFTTSRKYVYDVTAHFEAHNARGLSWLASSRVDCVDDDRVDRLHRAGCTGLFFGVESGSGAMQRTIRKGLKLERLDQLLDALALRGLEATTSFIVGFPEEREEDLDATILTAHRGKMRGASRVFFTQLVPLAGTEVTEQYFDQLTLLSGSTSMARRGFARGVGGAAAAAMIAGEKRLFSAFYSFPTPYLRDLHLEGLASFYKQAIGLHSAVLARLFDAGPGPVDLYRRWRVWLSANDRRSLDTDPAPISERLFGRFARAMLGSPRPRSARALDRSRDGAKPRVPAVRRRTC